MTSNAQKRAQAKFDKMNTTQVILKLNNKTDADIIAKLNETGNKQGYLKSLVRKDFKDEGGILSIDSIRYLVLPIVKKYEIKTLSLFGSYARNEATSLSDIDMLIDGGNYKGLLEYTTLIADFEKALGKRVDLVTLQTLEQGAKESDKLFKANIEKDLLVLI